MDRQGFYKIFIHNQTEGFDSLYLFGEEVIKRSNKVIIYDRLNKLEQSESLAFKQNKYGGDLTNYHKKEFYDIDSINPTKILDSKFHFEEHSTALKQLSERYDIPLFYYEDVFYGKGLDRLSQYLNIEVDDNLKSLYLDNSHRQRLKNDSMNLI